MHEKLELIVRERGPRQSRSPRRISELGARGGQFLSPGRGTKRPHVAIDTILVPVGGGGLIAGVAAAIKNQRPGARVVAVEPELAADLARASPPGSGPSGHES